MAQPLTAEQANAVYDILVEHAGAPEELFDGEFTTPRGDFVFHQTREHVTEYRFMGSLGFGGKFWNCGGRWYVTAYPGDMTPVRRRAIGDTNAALAALRHRDPIGRCPQPVRPGQDGPVTNPRDDALRQTSAAAEKYGVSEERIAELRQRLAGDNALGRLMLAAGWMHASLVRLAEEHHEDCNQAKCRTCDRIRDGLAMALAFVRAQMNDEFHDMMDPQRRRW